MASSFRKMMKQGKALRPAYAAALWPGGRPPAARSGLAPARAGAPVAWPKLRVSEPGDPLEREADRVADQVMRMPGHSTQGEGQPYAPAAATHAGSARGRPMDAQTRAFFEPRFGVDLGQVRVHTGPEAAASARSIGALAYTFGRDVVFDEGQYAPHRESGRRLLAHELAHVLQQQPAPARGGDGAPVRVSSAMDASTVARAPAEEGWMPTAEAWWGKRKEAAYDALIQALRDAKQRSLAELRAAAGLLPLPLRPVAALLIGQVEIAADLLISLGLAVIGLVVGLVSGIAHAVWGLLSMIYGILTGLILFVAGIFDPYYRGVFDERANAVIAGLTHLPENLRTLWDAWLAKFNAASTERQTLMIGELTGEIEAILLSALAGDTAARGLPALSLAPARQFAFAGARVAAGGGAMAIDLAGPGSAAVLSVNTAQMVADRAAQEKMWSDVGKEVGTESPKPKKRGVQEAMKDAEDFPRGEEPGKVNMEVHSHKDSPDVRDYLDVTGKEFQSAHANASSWLNKRVWRNGKLININYSRGDALATLLPPDVHQSFDRGWKAFAMSARKSGIDRVPVSRMVEEMRKAVAASSLSGAKQGSLMTVIESELRTMGLEMTDIVELPYPNL